MNIEIDKVYNCDCLKLMQEMYNGGVKVDCIITDPPYMIEYKTNRRKDKQHKFSREIINDNNPDIISKSI